MCAEHLLYTRLAEYYDVIYREYLEYEVPRLVDAVEEVFRKYAGRQVKEVLDIACGTGGPTLELARRGYSLTGVDLHREVVGIAKKKADRERLRADFKVGDARSLDKIFDRDSFDAVTMFFSSINYMIELDDLLNLLRSIKYVLRDGGVFVADAPNPYYSMYHYGHRGENTAVVWSVKPKEAGEDIVITDWREIVDWLKGIVKLMRQVSIIRRDGETRSYLISDTLRHYTGTELELAANHVGFKRTETLCYHSGKTVKLNGRTRCRRILFLAIK